MVIKICISSNCTNLVLKKLLWKILKCNYARRQGWEYVKLTFENIPVLFHTRNSKLRVAGRNNNKLTTTQKPFRYNAKTVNEPTLNFAALLIAYTQLFLKLQITTNRNTKPRVQTVHGWRFIIRIIISMRKSNHFSE